MTQVIATYATSRIDAWRALAEALGMRTVRDGGALRCIGDGTLVLEPAGGGASEHGADKHSADQCGPTSFVIAEGSVEAPSTGLSLMPLLMTPDMDGAERELLAQGVRPRLRSEDGGWRDFVTDAGQVALHRDAEERVELSFEHSGDLDALATRLVGAGFEADVVDEAYNRTLLVTTPDGWRLWINGVIDDLYGYQRAE